jgi:NADH-quinone oxidoreductase subunit N
MAASTNLLMIFLAIESVSLTSYLLVGFQKFDKRASEAALKYVLFGAVSTALMLFGMSLVFGVTGAIDLSAIGAFVSQASTDLRVMILIGMVFVLAGVGFKISMAPFHMWAPDVYQGAPTPVTAFLTVAPKALGFAVLARMLFLAFPSFAANWSHLLSILAIITMTVGNVFAISQFDIKRMLAYSSIAQAGYILVGVATASALGLQAVLIYAIAYMFTNLGAFFTVLAVERSSGSNDLAAYNGLSSRNPFLALAMMIFLLSLAGIPPTAGFIGKIYIFAAAIEVNAIGLAIAVAVNSAIAAFYYFKIVRAMYLTPAQLGAQVANPLPLKLAVGTALLGTLLIGLCPPHLIRLAQESLSAFPLF